jgi:hypothetical protein
VAIAPGVREEGSDFLPACCTSVAYVIRPVVATGLTVNHAASRGAKGDLYGSVLLRLPVKAVDAQSPADYPEKWKASPAGYLSRMWHQGVPNRKEQIEFRKEATHGSGIA